MNELVTGSTEFWLQNAVECTFFCNPNISLRPHLTQFLFIFTMQACERLAKKTQLQ